MILLLMLFAALFRVLILYPSYANGLPAAYDGYIHAAASYFVAKGGLEASPMSPIYPPLFLVFLAFLYQITGINPIVLIVPVGVIIDILCILPVFYITWRISRKNVIMGYLAAFFYSINPITTILIISGTVAAILAMLGYLLVISILVSDLRGRFISIPLMGLLGAFILLTNIFLSLLLVFLVFLFFVDEVLLRRERFYFKPLFFSLVLSVIIACVYYIPRLGVLNVSLSGSGEYDYWSYGNLLIMLILAVPMIFLFKRGLRERYIPVSQQHLTLLKLWYLSPPLITVAFVWQASIAFRMWQFMPAPTVVVIAMVAVMKFRIMKKARRRRTVVVAAASLLIVCLALTYTGSALTFEGSFKATPERLELMNWIKTNTSPNAAFCTEEEYFPTHLGWYIMGLTDRVAYESLPSSQGAFQLGKDVARSIKLAYDIVTLPVGSQEWNESVKGLDVTYVVLLANALHPNYASISDKIVFSNVAYDVYNVTQFTIS
jgi:hypothetical protein